MTRCIKRQNCFGKPCKGSGKSTRFCNIHRGQMVWLYYFMKSYSKAKNCFHLMYPFLTPPTRSTISRTVSRFESTGNTLDRKHTGRPRRQTNQQRINDVELHFRLHPKKSARKSIGDLLMSRSSIRRCLRSLTFHPYKPQRTEFLKVADPPERAKFCRKMLSYLSTDHSFLQNVITSDEAWFSLAGFVNSQNTRYYSDKP